VGLNKDDPERALWSKPFSCGCGRSEDVTDDNSAYGFSRDEILRRADDVHLVHCKPCRDKIVKGTLLDKAKLKGAKKAPKTATEQQQQQEKQKQKQKQQKQQQQQQQRPQQGGMTQRDWQLFGTAVLSKAAFIAGNVLMSALQ
jgi:hypothetical protein